jgi:hypothetical protein
LVDMTVGGIDHKSKVLATGIRLRVCPGTLLGPA